MRRKCFVGGFFLACWGCCCCCVVNPVIIVEVVVVAVVIFVVCGCCGLCYCCCCSRRICVFALCCWYYCCCGGGGVFVELLLYLLSWCCHGTHDGNIASAVDVRNVSRNAPLLLQIWIGGLNCFADGWWWWWWWYYLLVVVEGASRVLGHRVSILLHPASHIPGCTNSSVCWKLYPFTYHKRGISLPFVSVMFVRSPSLSLCLSLSFSLCVCLPLSGGLSLFLGVSFSETYTSYVSQHTFVFAAKKSPCSFYCCTPLFPFAESQKFIFLFCLPSASSSLVYSLFFLCTWKIMLFFFLLLVCLFCDTM